MIDGFPQDLRELTDTQTEEAVAFFTGLPLAELRHRQELNESIITLVFDQLEATEWVRTGGGRVAKDPEARERLERQFGNARIDADLLATAIDRKEFPEREPL